MKIDEKIQVLYKKRFEGEISQRNKLWKVLVKFFFQKYIKETDTVLDVGAGYCEFINQIKCAKKYAIDINPDIGFFANPDVKVYNCCLSDVAIQFNSSIDIIFMSNFLEHMETKDEIIRILMDCYKTLKDGGRILILGPNIKYAYKEYWDFFDHCIPLSDKSLSEALGLAGFRVEMIIPKFLPYSTKNKIPENAFLIMAYLKIPIIWKIMGKQMFIMSKKVKDKKQG